MAEYVRKSARRAGEAVRPPLDRAQEAELLARARDGDRDAFESLAVRAMPRLLGTATRMLGPGFAAEEAVADALYRAYRHVDRFRGGAAFSTWLHRIVCRVVADQFRRAGRDRRLRERLQDRLATGVQPRRRTEAPLSQLTHAETRSALREAAETLPPTQRLVLLLFVWEGLSLTDISDLLALKYATVKSHLHHARTSIRSRVDLRGIQDAGGGVE